MYPRNNATPPRIAVGAVVQIADGAVQTSGVSVVVRPEGEAESAGGGTIAYSAASGVVYYTPTQAETDYAAFCVIAYKAACIPAQVTVVTTASSTAGVAVLDSSARVKLDASQPDYAPATAAALAAMRGADNDTLKTLSDQIDGIDGGGLTGPFTRTITVADAADNSPIEAAHVRLYRTGETETKATDADGETLFTTEAATFSYAVIANGYGGASGTIVISANGGTTIELTATSVTPPTNPDLSAVVVSCLGTDFEPEAGVTIDLRIKTLPSGSTNTAYPGLKQTATSNGSGIATLEAPKGSVCEWKRGREDSWTEITIGSDDQTNVTSIIGSRY